MCFVIESELSITKAMPVSLPLPFVECSDVMCAMYCENGFKTGVDGCPICECSE